MTRLSHDTWVLVADGERALILRNEGDGDYPNLQVLRTDAQDNPKTSDQGTTRPGRYPDGPGHHRSAVEETDWHVLAKERFAEEIADRLYRNVHAGRFDRLVLVAAPTVLGILRATLHEEVRASVVGEIHKTLTNHPVDEMEKIIVADLAGTG